MHTEQLLRVKKRLGFNCADDYNVTFNSNVFGDQNWVTRVINATSLE